MKIQQTIFSTIQSFEPEYWVIKYLWIFLLMPLQFLQFVALTVVVGLMWVQRKIDLRMPSSLEGKLFVSWVGLYFVSIVANSIMSDFSLRRIVADLTKTLVLLYVYALYRYFKETAIDWKKLIRYMQIQFGVMIAISFLYLLASRQGWQLQLLNRVLVQKDYYNDEIVNRLGGFLEYSTANATLIIAALPIWLRIVHKDIKHSFWLVLLYLPIVLVKSRNGMITYAIGVYGLIYEWIPKPYKKWWFLAPVIAFGASLIMNMEWVLQKIQGFLGARSMSNQARLRLYQETLEATFQNLWTALFGRGVRVGSSNRLLLLGTHCSYLSVLYRTGIIGFIGAMVATVKKMYDIIQTSSHKVWITCCIAMYGVYAVFEDLDQIHVIFALIAISLGLLQNWNEKEEIR